MSGRPVRATRDDALADALKRIRILERVRAGGLFDGYCPYQILDLPFQGSGSYDTGFDTWTLDETLFGGGYLDNSAGGANDGDFFVLKVLLGPVGSQWGFDLYAKVGTDYGKLTISLASASEDGTFTGTIEDPSSLTYFGIGQQDFYDTPASDRRFDRISPFRMLGELGDPITATSTDPETGLGAIDGGPGLYYVKFAVDGKNGSSSGYKMAFQFLAAERFGDSFL